MELGDGYGSGNGSGYGNGYGSGDGYGSGSGNGYGYGYGSGNGYGSGYGYGYGSGDGSGDGYGSGNGSGYGSGNGSGDGYGNGSGSGNGNGNGYGSGYGSGSGDGDGYGSGSGSGYGDGSGNGDGYGSGSGSNREKFFEATKSLWPTAWALTFPNTEVRRELLEIIGTECLFSQVATKPIDKDVDLQGNERALIRIECEDAEGGFLQAVRVVCPTTQRVYHLLVSVSAKTCQEAVASTFGMSPDEYYPIRES